MGSEWDHPVPRRAGHPCWLMDKGAHYKTVSFFIKDLKISTILLKALKKRKSTIRIGKLLPSDFQEEGQGHSMGKGPSLTDGAGTAGLHRPESEVGSLPHAI